MTIHNKKVFPLGLLLIIAFAACTPRPVSHRHSSGAQAAPGIDSSEQTTQPRLVIQSGHANSVNGIAFNSDGKLIASAGGERSIKVWDAGSVTQLRSLEGHAGPVYPVAFSPDR